MRNLNNKWTMGIALFVPVAALVNGCASPSKPPEAVLAGTWSLVPANATTPALSELLLTFDSNGNLTQTQYQVGSNAVVTTPIIGGDTTVNGSDVTISVGFLGNTLSFAGTLNSTNDLATGNLTTVITVGLSTVTIDNGAATMTKQ